MDGSGGGRFLLSTGRGLQPQQQRATVAQEAREAREARARARQQEVGTAKVQRGARRWLERRRARRELEVDLDKKLADVAALQRLMASKGLPFCPPLPASSKLLRQWLFISRGCRLSRPSDMSEAERLRVGRLCACVLQPHLRQPPPTALLQGLAVTDLHKPPLKLIPRLLDLLLAYAAAVDYAYTASSGDGDASSLLTVLPTIGLLCKAVAADLDWPSTVYPVLRAICLRHEAAFFTPSRSRGPSSTHTLLAASPGFQALFQLAQDLLASAAASSSFAAAAFYDHTRFLLTIPSMATATQAQLPAPPILPKLLEALRSLTPVDLPLSPNPAAPSAVWLLSNVATIVHAALLQSPSPAATAATRALLLEQGGLAALTAWLADAPPGLVSEQGLVSLLTKGATSVTLCVDPQVTAAARLLFHEAFVRRLATTTLLRPEADGEAAAETAAPLKALERPEDRRAVSRAAALDLTFAAHEAHRAQREAPLITRVARRVGSLFGWGGQPTAATDGDGSEDDEEEAREGAAEQEGQEQPTAPSGATAAGAMVGLEPLVAFLATALWKCHAAEAAQQHQPHGGSSSSSSSLGNPIKRSILSTLVFPQNGAAIRRLWLHLLTQHPTELQRVHKLNLAAYATPDDCPSAATRAFLLSLALLAGLLQHQLLVLTDEELRSGQPLPVPHLIRLIRLLQRLGLHGCVGFANQIEAAAAAAGEARGGGPGDGSAAPFGKFVLVTACQLLRRLFERWSRRAFCVAEVFALADGGEARRAERAVQGGGALGKLLLQTMPFSVPFPERLELFRAWARAEKRTLQSPDLPPLFVKIRRNYLLEDGLTMLDNLRGTSLRRRLIIVFISQTGTQEAGVDSGGLLREFVAELCTRAFAPDFGIFARTPGEGLLYPNPSAALAHGADHLKLFEMVGAILGKAVFEGIVIDALFAPFFLGTLRGRAQWFHVLDDVRQLDPEVHKNLTFLRGCPEAEVEALGLTFTVARDDLGKQEELELAPGGKDVAVTAANRFAYIQALSKYHIVDRLAPQTQAFARGFHAVVPPAALQAFSEPELQILVSGSLAGIDVADMRRHAQYGGGYTGADRHVRRLWEVLGAFSQEELALFLQFVTSSKRAPTGGFGTLHPPLTIVRVPIRRDDERLPVGRTCFNQLLWPTYKSKSVAREMLLYAISAQAGFELT